MSALEEI